MPVHSFKHGDRVRLTVDGRAEVIARLTEFPKEVPVYALHPGTVVEIDVPDVALQLFFAGNGLDLFVYPDGSDHGPDDPIVVSSEWYELEESVTE